MNQVKQNRTHIKALQRVLPTIHESAFKSTIVFSERCELKKIAIQSSTIKVIKRGKLLQSIQSDSDHALSGSQIESTYASLKGYTQVNDHIKQTHIEDIKKKYKS